MPSLFIILIHWWTDHMYNLSTSIKPYNVDPLHFLKSWWRGSSYVHCMVAITNLSLKKVGALDVKSAGIWALRKSEKFIDYLCTFNWIIIGVFGVSLRWGKWQKMFDLHLVLSKYESEYSNTRQNMQNPSYMYLQLFVNDFVVSGSSFHKFENG